MTTEKQKKFYQCVEDLTNPLSQLLKTYEELDFDSNLDTSEKYPFGISYDEWFEEFLTWKNNLYEKWICGITRYSPTITVGELKKVIADLPDSTQITVQDKGWWLNITQCQKPIDDSLYTFTLNFSLSNTFDTRQI